MSYNFRYLKTQALLLAVICIQICQVSCQYSDCQLIKDCTKCIQTSNCVWCGNHEFEAPNHLHKNTPRCNTIENHRKNPFCKDEYLEIPRSFKIIEDSRGVSRSKVHISPQKAQVQLAVGIPITIDLTYLEAHDKPLDLYYILDLSHTMKDSRDTVARQSQELAAELKKLTKEVRLGFGSFIDKPVLPFVSYGQITGKGWEYAKPYGFKNVLSLTPDIGRFQTAVQNSKISGNIDLPEGGLEAIMQAIVCNKEIGWRENSRRLIVMATDGPFHIAGDGKIGGIVIPNDMKCHLDKNNDYTHSTLIDYPSIGQLNSTVIKNRVYLIFAVTKSQLPLYRELSEHISSSAAAELEENSNNVVQLVKTQYETITKQVQLERKGYEGFVDVKYRAKCKVRGSWEDSNKCSDLGPGNKAEFQVTLTLKECPIRQDEQNLVFSTYDLRGKEDLKINLNLICGCNCTKQQQPIETDKEILNQTCSGNARRLQCGKCICDSQHTGINCECSRLGDDTNNKTNCIDPKGQSECSTRGKCECGLCNCDKGYSGQFCQCDDTVCRINPNKDNEKGCSGQGKCVCGKCECDDQHGGEKCQCPKEMTTCKEPGSKDFCNSHGKCSCTRPDISDEWEWQCPNCDPGYSGKYCHICRGCTDKSMTGSKCDEKELIDCLKCHLKSYEKSSTVDDDCVEPCSRMSTDPGNEIEKYEVKLSSSISDEENNAIRCQLEYNETCSTMFVYSYQSGTERLNLKVTVGTQFTCKIEPPLLWYIIGVVGGVLLIGILTLLLWKLFTYFLDTREYQRFEKERAAAKWDRGENPLYNNPMSTFENPSYRG